ncbi:hypothetical protein [Novosphingobium sediminis]|nr:hypothetical protein [Novosphingobium sediminis]
MYETADNHRSAAAFLIRRLAGSLAPKQREGIGKIIHVDAARPAGH